MADQTQSMKSKQQAGAIPEAAEKRSNARKTAAPESTGFDKKLDGPDRPST
ncbi:hypothetical protein [Paenibacillus sp. GCM10027626]|uniref:hypothetical protein n=1 Tax=Paenibacillus sp. GCM10027626 TaxID=3273411 RepID=UPI00363B8D4D